MRRACLLLSFGLFACQPAGEALRVTLETTPGRAETCFVVQLRDRTGATLGETRFPRLEDRSTYLVGIGRASSPAEVTVFAQALIGADCATASRTNGSISADTRFETGRVVDVTLALTTGDADGDGFVSTVSGGLDCNDSDPSISPGATEPCIGTIDHDCNGLTACDDPACAGMVCGGAATRLRLGTALTTLRLGDCAAESIALQDAQGRSTAPDVGARLVPTGPFRFFADAQCSSEVTDLPLSTSTSLWLSATQPGSAMLAVSSRGLQGDQKTLTVEPSLPTSVRFSSAPLSTVAGRCSSALELELVDAHGAPTTADGTLALTLSTDAGGVFGLYLDPACALPTTTLAFDAGTGRNTFHFAGQKAAAFSMRAEEPTVGSIEQLELITPGAVSSVQVQAPAGAVVTGTCSAVAVQARDLFGNLVTPQQVDVVVPDAGATVYSDTTCSTPGTGTPFGLKTSNEGTFTLTVTADGVSNSVPLTTRAPGPAGGTWRWPLTVVTGARAPAGGYQGYTLLAAFDSRDAVDAGLVSASLDELRVFFASDAGWREVDRIIESPNAAGTTIRFASQSDLPSSSTTLSYSLFAGTFDGGVSLRDPHVVYLFADDFEEGTLARWTIRGGAWTRATDAVHSGLGSLKFGPEGNNDRVIEAKPALAETDLMFEAWWTTSNTGTVDFSQMVRLQPSVLTGYETNLENTTGWNIAWLNAGNWTELVANRGTPTANTWARMGVSISSNELRVWKDRVQLVPQTGSYALAAPALAAGNVGFRKHNLAGSVWLDDVTVRRYTEPEPNVSVGAPFLSP